MAATPPRGEKAEGPRRLPVGTTVPHRQEHHADPGDPEAQHGIFDPQHAAGQQSVEEKEPRRHPSVVPAGEKQQMIKADGQQRQAEFLRIVSPQKAVGHHGEHPRRRYQEHSRPGRGIQPGELVQVDEPQGHGGHLQPKHADEGIRRYQVGQPVKKIQQRSLLFKQIPVGHQAGHHPLAHCEKAVLIHPVLIGVQIRAHGSNA